jgi:hypothetical protein
MKMFAVLATALLLLGAAPAMAQGYQGKSDDYVCNHGDPADPATAEACARLRGPGAGAPSNTVSDQAPTPTPAPTQTATTESAPYRQGQSDRQRYEAWHSGLSGDALAGASWWAAHRSETSPAPCAGAGSATTGPGWSQGCLAAQRQLANFDRLRRSSPDYRQGWNHPASATPETVASAAPAPVAAAPAPSTDVGESPLGSGANADSNANAGADNADDQGSAEVSIDSSHWPWRWLHALGAMAIVAVIIGLFSGLAIYFIPTLIAMARRKRNTAAIFALNLFLGWSFIGWVAALIWSLAHDAPPRK